MKLRLTLFLFSACTLLAGRATAQGCSTAPLHFPPSGGRDVQLNSGTCTASVDRFGHQSGRLQWNGHNLQLFDTDEGGRFLWCAGGGNNRNNCAFGTILCLQQDGNAVMYTPRDGQGTIRCGNNGDGGRPTWASNTQGDCGLFGRTCTDEDTEELFVQDNLNFNGTNIGEAAVIYNDIAPGSDEGRKLLWHSLSSD